MIRSSLAVVLSVASAAVSPALAQSPSSGVEFLAEAPSNTFRVTKAKGIAVIGQDHTRLGEVQDLLIDSGGKLQAVVIGVGGVLGLGERTIAVPYAQVLWNTGDVTRQSDLGASTAPSKETGPGSTPPKVLDRMPGANISPEVLRSSADQSSGAVNPATGAVAAPNQAERATATLIPPGGTLQHAEIRATKAEIQQAPEFKLR
jgi:sporulation protein YlmC with PRC-barrel domain